MTVFKCKMCGGDIEIVPGTTVGTCTYCGSTMTLPQIDSDKALRMYDRANTYRLNKEFDKAYDAYKAIIEEDEQAAEAYWGLVLSEYGIEYVEDSKTHKRIPTCHRTHTTSILESSNYKLACKYADAESRLIYQEEAEAIDKIQKHIMAVSSKEEPYDVFISYKELNDADGQRTSASVLAQEIYDALTKEGIRVFFSRISLEDKLGTDYEPYIFAALRSAKVMLVVATDSSQCDAVWVKNEWSRYLKFMEEDHSKTIVPVFQTMTAYEFPHELQRFQAQDMSKLGAMQDLVRGVLKLTEFDEKKKSSNTTDVIVATMLKRAEESLQKKDWGKAAEYFSNVLDYDVNNVEAYIGKLLAERSCISVDDLAHQTQSLEASENYKKLIGLCSKEQKAKFKAIEEKIQQNIASAKVIHKKRNKRIAIISTSAVLAAAIAVGAYFTAKNVIIPERNYKTAIASYDSGDYETALEYFALCQDYKDCSEYVEDAYYQIAAADYDAGNYDAAIKYFKDHLDYKDSTTYMDKNYYRLAWEAIDDGDYRRAYRASENISSANSELRNEICYQVAEGYVAKQDYKQAIVYYTSANYKDSKEKTAEVRSLLHQQLAESLSSAEVGDTVTFGTYEQDGITSNGAEAIEWVVLDRVGNKALLYSTENLISSSYNSTTDTTTGTTWETCSLRESLNKYFLNQAFDETDQAHILDSLVTADRNPEYGTDPGNDTTDKIFLLSATEQAKYEYYLFGLSYDAWLRTPGSTQDKAMTDDDTDGKLVYYTAYVHPAMWVNIDAQ